jgi:hypothetical protein
LGDEFCPAMMWVRFELNEAIHGEFIDDALHSLPIEAHAAGVARHGLQCWRQRDLHRGSATVRWSTRAPRQVYACREKTPIQPKHL